MYFCMYEVLSLSWLTPHVNVLSSSLDNIGNSSKHPSSNGVHLELILLSPFSSTEFHDSSHFLTRLNYFRPP